MGWCKERAEFDPTLSRSLSEACAGYMEMGESSAEGAARETMEEAQAAVEVRLLYDVPCSFQERLP